MKQLDIFLDKEFQDLDLTKKQSIAHNYFDKEMADEEFAKLDATKQSAIKANFVNSQLDFDVSDTFDKAKVVQEDIRQGIVSTLQEAFLKTATEPTVKHPLVSEPVVNITKPTNPFPVDTLGTIKSDDVTATREFKPAQQTPAEIFNNEPAKMLSPLEQDLATVEQNKKTFTPQTQLSDYGDALASGAAGIYEGAGWALEHAGDAIGSDGLTKYGTAVRDTGKEAKQYWKDGLSPEALKAQKENFTVRDDKGDISVSDTLANIVANPAKVGLMSAESIPAMGLGMGIGGMLAKGFTLIPSIGEKLAAAAGYGLGEGITAAPIQGVQTEEKVMGMKHDDLMQHPEYRAMFKKLGDEKLAKQAIAKATGGDAAMYDFVTTTLLSAPFGYVMSPLFAGAKKEASELVRKGIGQEALTTGAEELGQEVLQSGAEQVGGNLAVQQHANEKQALMDGVAESMVAGGVGGFAMGGLIGGGQTAMNNQKLDTFEAEKEKARDAYIQDVYNKQMMGSGLVATTDDAGYINFSNNLNDKVKTIQDEFQNLVINHPEHEVPIEAVNNIEIQAEVVKSAKQNGLNVSDNNGLNAIDVGFTELQNELFGNPEQLSSNPLQLSEALKPKGFEETPVATQTPIIEKPIIGEPEPEAVVKDSLTTDNASSITSKDELQTYIDNFMQSNNIQDAYKIKADKRGYWLYRENPKDNTITGGNVNNEKMAKGYYLGDYENFKNDENNKLKAIDADNTSLMDYDLQDVFSDRLESKLDAVPHAEDIKDKWSPVPQNPISFEDRKKTFSTYWDSATEQQRSDLMGTYWNEDTKQELVKRDAADADIIIHTLTNLHKDDNNFLDTLVTPERTILSNMQENDNIRRVFANYKQKRVREDTQYLKQKEEEYGVESKQYNEAKERMKKSDEFYQNHFYTTAESMLQDFDSANMQRIHDRFVNGSGFESYKKAIEQIRDIKFGTTKKATIEALDTFFYGKYSQFLQDRNKQREVETAKADSERIIRSLENQKVNFENKSMSRKEFLDTAFESGYTVISSQKRGATDRYILENPEESSSYNIKKEDVTYIEILQDMRSEKASLAEEEDMKNNPDKYMSEAEINDLFTRGNKSDIIKLEVQDNANTRDDRSGRDANKASGELGVPTNQQSTSNTGTKQGSDKPISEGNRRPDGLGTNGSTQDEISNGYVGVDGYKTTGKNQQSEQQSTDANGVLPKSDEPNSTENYSLEGKSPVTLTKGQRKKFNDAALEIIKKPIEEITGADREVLRHYTGEGGLGEANENSVNQHYTNYETVQSIYKALVDADVPMDKILEPAVGSGNFVGFMPNASWDVVDIDMTNIEITKRLYPQIKNFYADTYETFQGKNYDLVISNVPFASAEMLMREHAMTIKPAFKAIHNFYFAHSMDKVKENGVIAFMTSTGMMDGTTTARQLRKYLMDRGDILGAFRLPEKSQAKNAHTDTMIDIIFIQKRPEGVKSRQEDVNNQFVNIGNKDGFAMNEYLIQHPENLLGDEVVVGKDKTKMGKEGWIVKGEPKFENIKISYEPYKAVKKEMKEQSLFYDDTAVFAYAKENGLEVKSFIDKNLKSHSIVDEGKIVFFDKVFSYENSEQKGMFGKVLKGENTKKALLLENIKMLTEDGVRLEDKAMLNKALTEIQNYKQQFEKSPHNDIALKRFMKEYRLDIALKEYMSYFDKDFNPAPIYGEQTRFKDSGNLEINEKSPLIEKALYYSTGDAVIDTSREYKFLSAEEIKELESNRSFLRSGVNEIQLDFMYYSGNVYSKLDTLDGMRKYHNMDINDYNEQYKKLKAIVPTQIPFKNITVKGGESWLPNAIRNAISTERGGELYVHPEVFDGDRFKSELYDRYLNKKALAPKGKDESDQENIQRTMEATKLLSEVLVPQVMRYIEKQGLAEILTDEYNKNSNFYVRPEMTGVLLRELPKTFRGKPFTMQSHQMQGAEKLVFNKKGVLAFAPGGGKTITAIVAVMNLVQQGVMKKPLFVVPVNTIAQWENSVKELYQNASVFEFPKVKSGVNKGNAKEWTQLSREEKEQMAFDLANNRYDFTIIGDTMFQKFGLPSNVMSEFVDDLVEQIQAVEEAEAEDSKSKKKGVSAEAKKRALKNGLKQAYGSDVEFDFAKMGFDGLIADEVQYYKNIGLGGRDIKGGLGASVVISYTDKEGNALNAKDIAEGKEPNSATLGSMRSYDFRFKSKYVSKNNNGNNVILLTGTPTPNKPLELYTLLQHLDENILNEYGIISSKDFVDTFYYIEEFETTDSTGKIVKREALASMKNLDWMGKILDRFVDYKGFKDMPELPRPKQVDVQHYLKLSKAGEKIFQDVQHRILTAMEDAKKVKSGLDSSGNVEIALVAMGAGRSASIDLRLYDVGTKGKSSFTPDELFDVIENDIATYENNKILKTIELLTKQYKENSNSGQIIFLDRLSVKNSDGSVTSTHAEMRDKILATGLFSDTEVVFVNGAAFVNPTTGKVSKSSIKPDMLNKIMDMYNAGTIKVIIGNTSKLGVGVDLNRKTTDIYQLDIPFRPDEIEQRSNRGVRQGNENAEVRVHQFFQLGTFDKRSYDIVMKKRGFNDMYKFSENEDLVVVDGVSMIDNSNTTDPYQAVIDLERDPFERERLRKQRVIENAVIDANNLKNIITKLDADIKTKQGSIKNYNDAIKGINENLMPQNFPKYEGIKDEAEKKEKLEKHIQALVERKAKYENTIQGIDLEISEIEAKADERKTQQADHEAETKFITDEFTNDGKNVDIEKIKEAYTLEQILKSEGKSKAEIESYMEDAGDADFSNSYMKVPPAKLGYFVDKSKIQYGKNSNITNLDLEHIILDENNLKEFNKIEFNEDEWFREFGLNSKDEDYLVSSEFKTNVPLVIKSGTLTKLVNQERHRFFTKIKPTLEMPSIVALHDGALVFFKSFVDGANHKHFYSVAKDYQTGEWIISSNGVRTISNLRNKINEGKVLYIRGKVPSTTAKAEVVQILDSIKPKSVSNPNDNSRSSYSEILTEKEQESQENADAYARANGYDEAGVNYVPNYSVSGIPNRPLSGTILLGKNEIKLPTLDKPINADSLRVYLSDIIGNRLYDGKIKGKSALGVYQRKDSAIRLKNYSDVEVMAHETAHFLDFFLNNKSKTAKDSFFRSVILKNKVEVKALSYTTDPKKVLSEGFAEFIRLWLTNYNTLTLVAPTMVKDFEARLAKDKNLQSKMEMLQTGMHQFYYQGADAGLRSKQGGELNATAKKLARGQKEIGKDIRQSAIDKIHSIKRIEAEILGDNPKDAMDSAYKILQLAEHASSIMHTAMHFGIPTVTQSGDLTYSGKALNDIFAPATKVSEERVRLLSDYLVAMRADELMGQGRENLITKDEIKAGLALAQKYPEFEAIFNEYQTFNDGMLDFYVAMNLITSSQKENFQEMNKNYVPFHRVTESVQNGVVPPAKIGQRLTGGTHSLGNIMENIINGLESNIKQALISRGKSVFFKMLDDSGMGGVFATKVSAENKLVKSDIAQQAKKVAQLMAELGVTVAKDGMIFSGSIDADVIVDVNEIEQNLLDNPSALEFWTHGHKPTSQTGYIETVIIDDKKVYFEVHDAGLVDSLTSFSGANYNSLVQGLMIAKNIMTWNITNNPLFYLTNFVRDTTSASVLSKNKFIPIITSVVGMYHFIMKTPTFKAFMASGGGYGTRRTTLGGDVDSMAMLEVNRGLEVVSKLLAGMAYGADIFEYGTRVGDFALAQKAGKSYMQSSFEANDVSTDFTIKGSNRTWTGFLATVPFMKAGINGIDKTAKRIFSLNGEMKLSNSLKFKNQLGELQGHKLKLYIMGGLIATASLALWIRNRDDDRYKRLTKDQKLMYWHFFIGDTHIKIPRPFDIGFAFATVPEIVADGIYTKHGEDAVKDFIWGVKTMFSVGNVSGLFQPILNHAMNTNWKGSPILPTYLDNLDDKGDQYLNATPLMYKEFGKKTGISPILTQHYVDGYLGLTAKMVEHFTEGMLWNSKDWGERPFSQNPAEFLTYRFKGKEQDSTTKYSEKYYELMQKAGAVKNSFESKKQKAFLDKGQDIKNYMNNQEKGAYVQLSKLMSHYNKTLTEAKNSVEHISYSKDLSKSEKEKKINEIYTKKTEGFKTATEAIEKELKKFEDK